MGIFRVFSEFVLHVLVSVTVVYFLFTWWDALPAYDSKKIADPASLANTFMVFVTFIVVVATVAITIVGLYLSRWWARERRQVLSENWSDMMKTVKEDDKLMSKLKEDLLSESLEEMMKEHIETHKKTINNNLKSEIVKAEERIIAKLKMNYSDLQVDSNADNITLQ